MLRSLCVHVTERMYVQHIGRYKDALCIITGNILYYCVAVVPTWTPLHGRYSEVSMDDCVAVVW
eukprot:m.1258308 g.1258308  ORF g.1258308 m.1258308 type:complete len:64 (-) comp24718_c0_seq4:3454-3645(-)